MLKHITYLWLLVIVVGASRPKPWEFPFKPWEFNGTTPNIKDIIIGRCYTFQEISPVNRKESLKFILNCKQVWQNFRSGFADIDACDVTEDDYKPFFEYIDSKKRTKDQLLFWSGMHRLSGDLGAVNDHFYTLEKTMAGYLTDHLKWCGCVNDDDGDTEDCVDGINYKSCKREDKCSSTRPFWRAASRDFAKKAEGTAYVMLNGTTRGERKAYRIGSHFRTYELPMILEKKKVNKLVIFVVNDLGVPPRETCKDAAGPHGTVGQLIQDAKAGGIGTVDCIDNPKMIKNLLCAKFPEAKEECGGNFEYKRSEVIVNRQFENFENVQ